MSRLFSGVEGNFTRMRNFTRRVSDCEESLIMLVLNVFGEWNNFITSFLTLHKNGGVVFGNIEGYKILI